MVNPSLTTLRRFVPSHGLIFVAVGRLSSLRRRVPYLVGVLWNQSPNQNKTKDDGKPMMRDIRASLALSHAPQVGRAYDKISGFQPSTASMMKNPTT
jgi:hypothetical protein